tara:strand:+ start:740 stop:928 length:189 start_codon:yes stop_codon:yes gene_type:complete
MAHPHERLVKALGGSTAVSRIFKTSPQAVNQWRTKGVPWKYRARVRLLCEEREIRIPKDFET